METINLLQTVKEGFNGTKKSYGNYPQMIHEAQITLELYLDSISCEKQQKMDFTLFDYFTTIIENLEFAAETLISKLSEDTETSEDQLIFLGNNSNRNTSILVNCKCFFLIISE